jgi:hypothetical protein
MYFREIWSILRPFEIFYGHLVYFVVIWYISPRFGKLYQDKYGNPDDDTLDWLGSVHRRKLKETFFPAENKAVLISDTSDRPMDGWRGEKSNKSKLRQEKNGRPPSETKNLIQSHFYKMRF